MITGTRLLQKVPAILKNMHHFVSRDQIFNDLKNGTLSQVSWLIPRDNASEHSHNIMHGMDWIVYVVSSIMESPY